MTDNHELVAEMRIYLDDKHYAFVKFREQGEVIYLDTVMVPAKFRRQGIASRLMRRLITLSEGLNKAILLSARPIGAGGASDQRLARLVHFYQGFGFSATEQGITAVKMVRRPNGPASQGGAPSP